MFPALELGVALAILAQLSAGQSMLSSTLYRRITIEASTWSDIRAHTLTGSKRLITCFSPDFLNKNVFIIDLQGFNVRSYAQQILTAWDITMIWMNAMRVMALV